MAGEARDARDVSGPTVQDLVAKNTGTTDVPKLDMPKAPEGEALAMQADGTVNFPLPDGRVLTMRKPSALVGIRISRWLGQQSMNPMLAGMYRALSYVSAFDGQPVMVNTEPELIALANRLGDDGVDAVMAVYGSFWPPYVPAGLPQPDLPK